MKVLGLMTTRNGENRVQHSLDNLGAYCDEVYVLNDRSTDSTLNVLKSHPAVSNVFSADHSISTRPWFFPESQILNFLYRMADFCVPDWVVMLGDDEWIQPSATIRDMLQAQASTAVGVKFQRISPWNDPLYPKLARLVQPDMYDVRMWRYSSGLTAGDKNFHNGYKPVNLERNGRIVEGTNHTLIHTGWDTFRKRISRVDLYSSLDPSFSCNKGVSYDESLLFGHSRDELFKLSREYRVTSSTSIGPVPGGAR